MCVGWGWFGEEKQCEMNQEEMDLEILLFLRNVNARVSLASCARSFIHVSVPSLSPKIPKQHNIVSLSLFVIILHFLHYTKDIAPHGIKVVFSSSLRNAHFIAISYQAGV
ncbi:hypothetical protein HBH64_022150 [Parastagonospora nodorum]|nr:hypothetical protein HBH52_242230 [Parastagonospora nodorum]KAH4075445.1 hypothetical protein HBH50_016850 [Parastagonospora nodorum]KAH4079768.1 hypothetical protein HBH46_232160 [Parastagonospora nodorum]KAH4098250.1 hypothetical protein HBH48_030450 [Parastagonospora nodorum]KAH4234359.1 hypothetical protein HBI05_157170 [Parastagonospora nodorum]